MSNDSITKTLIVAGLLCIVCSVIVSYTAVTLKPVQERNKALETKKNILAAAGLLDENSNVEEQFKLITAKVIDLATGEISEQDPERFDQKKAAKNPETSVAITDDRAKIQRRSKYASVYLVQKDNITDTIILPIHGKGLWSTMYAFLALAGDANTVKGLSFYEHGETPGLGGEVDNRLWKKKWIGKKVFDENWRPALKLPKGVVDPSKPDAIHEVDGLAGATLTTRGVENLILYWLGEDGFGPFLSKMRKQKEEI
jgi:Na+-transporting NADH:ubiquinone oxidoreductase subunit C